MQAIRICFVGGGSLSWAAHIVRDIIFKEGMDRVRLEIALLDIDLPAAKTIEALFAAWLPRWKVADRVRVWATSDKPRALAGADFVIVAISVGGLGTMRHDLAVPEKYGIYHTVGDTSGPGGWSRALRNIPVFHEYARLIRRHAPNAFVLNYTNPMGALTNVLARELGRQRVVGLCHGLFGCYDILKDAFGLTKESDIEVRFGGLNHFFWLLDLRVKGADGYALLRCRLKGRNLAEWLKAVHTDAMGWSSNKWLAGELFDQYGCLTYLGDRHTCEFFASYMTDLDLHKRFRLVRTTIADRAREYRRAAIRIRRLTRGAGPDGQFSRKPSRETAADIIKAISFNEPFVDVVNTVNVGQIDNLPRGAVVETKGHVSALGFTPHTVGPLPEPIRALVAPHADVQMRTVDAGLAGDLDAALEALAADPVCARLTASDAKRMGLELLNKNCEYLPQFFRRRASRRA